MREKARKTSTEGKLEGPFKVKESLHNGAYRLQQLDDRVVLRT